MSWGGLVWIQATSDEVRGSVSRLRGQAATGVLYTSGPSHWNSGPWRRQPCRFRQRTASRLLHSFCLPSPGHTQLTGSCQGSPERRVSAPEIQEGKARNGCARVSPRVSLPWGYWVCTQPTQPRAYPGAKNLCGCQMPSRQSMHPWPPGKVLNLASFSWTLCGFPILTLLPPIPLFPISPPVSFHLYFFLPFFSALPAHSLFLPPLSFL